MHALHGWLFRQIIGGAWIFTSNLRKKVIGFVQCVPREAKLTVWASINNIVNSKVCIIMAAIAYSIVQNLGLVWAIYRTDLLYIYIYIDCLQYRCTLLNILCFLLYIIHVLTWIRVNFDISEYASSTTLGSKFKGNLPVATFREAIATFLWLGAFTFAIRST